MSNMKVVIVGNGFDLYHKLGTSFNEFIEYISKNKPGDLKIPNSGNRDVLGVLVEQGYARHVDSKRKNFDYKKDWNKMEEYLGCLRVDQEYKIVKSTISSLFQKYIEEEVNGRIEEIKLIDSILKNEFNTADLIINFNYTETISKYIDSTVYYIHGKFDKNIIIGTEIERDAPKYMINNGEFGNSQFISKSNNIAYSSKEQERKELDDGFQFKIKNSYNDIISSAIIDEVVIIGHSLGRTDIKELKRILSKTANIKYYSINKEDDENQVESNLNDIGLNADDYKINIVEYREKDNKYFPFFKDKADVEKYVYRVLNENNPIASDEDVENFKTYSKTIADEIDDKELVVDMNIVKNKIALFALKKGYLYLN